MQTTSELHVMEQGGEGEKKKKHNKTQPQTKLLQEERKGKACIVLLSSPRQFPSARCTKSFVPLD